MPELPEVETVRRALEVAMPDGTCITKIELLRKDLRWPMPTTLKTQTVNAQIKSITRRAKYLLMHTDQGIILSHLGMSGSWRIANGSTSNNDDRMTHDHVHIFLSNKTYLVYHDPRRFGMLDWLPGKSPAIEKHFLLKDLGPEPLDLDAFTSEYLFQKTRKKSVAIKILLMNQKIVVGVGNIYASEALFLAKVKPSRHAGKVTRLECESIVLSIREVLEAALANGGSTIRDYRSPDGKGAYQDRLKVYDREEERCLTCGTQIQQKVLGGRSTFWCATCQK